MDTFEPETRAKGSTAEWAGFHSVSDVLRVGRLPEAWMEEVEALTHARMTRDAASVATMRRVQNINHDSFWGIFEKAGAASHHRLIGYEAFLFLNRAGVAALLDRTLDTKDPDSRFVAPCGERPAAIYNWGVVAERLTKLVAPTIAREMPRLYYGLMHYATPATEAGYRAGTKGGFTPLTPHDDRIGGLFQYDGFVKSSAPGLRVVTASGPAEFSQALAIRSAVFLAEQDCPYDEEFDGNDYCASHLVGTVDGEPAATMRMRYFADWVKLERMAVLPRFRRSDIKYEIVRAAFELARRKGYRLVYGQAQRRLLKFWQQFGFEIYPRNAEIRFSDYDYVEIVKRLEPHADPLTMRSDPMVLIRPEGRWDEVGILERSAARSSHSGRAA